VNPAVAAAEVCVAGAVLGEVDHCGAAAGLVC
jgi:hypothetical protein